MFNREVLLAAGGGVMQEPVKVTVNVTSISIINILGFVTPSDIDKAPIYITLNGEKIWLLCLYDFYNEPQFTSYSRTTLGFTDGSSLGIDSFRVTRVDTKETFVLHKDNTEQENVFTSTLSVPFFHGLKKGDTVELLFDPVPVDYH